MDTQYRIERLCGCIITYGTMPIRAMVDLMEELGDEAQMEMLLAKKLGASMVMGCHENLEALAQEPSIKQQITQRIKASTEGFHIPQSAIRWLEDGHRGMSSDTIFVAMTGVPLIEAGDMSHPRDVSDFLRCRSLLESVPEFAQRRDELKALSAHWSALVVHWDELCASVDAEAPSWREQDFACPTTYSRIKALYEPLH